MTHIGHNISHKSLFTQFKNTSSGLDITGCAVYEWQLLEAEPSCSFLVLYSLFCDRLYIFVCHGIHGIMCIHECHPVRLCSVSVSVSDPAALCVTERAAGGGGCPAGVCGLRAAVAGVPVVSAGPARVAELGPGRAAGGRAGEARLDGARTAQDAAQGSARAAGLVPLSQGEARAHVRTGEMADWGCRVTRGVWRAGRAVLTVCRRRGRPGCRKAAEGGRGADSRSSHGSSDLRVTAQLETRLTHTGAGWNRSRCGADAAMLARHSARSAPPSSEKEIQSDIQTNYQWPLTSAIATAVGLATRRVTFAERHCSAN